MKHSVLVVGLIGAALLFSVSLNADETSVSPLPKVLIIGDSISLGYTPFVKSLLKDKAAVVHNQGNAASTICGVQAIDKWIGDKKWDVIHFNWGLWDMYGWRYWKEDISPEAYEKRLTEIVRKLRKTGATLIWATTTPPCTDSEVTMKKKFGKDVIITTEKEKQYLQAAERVMKKFNVRINDLRKVILPVRSKYSLGSTNVHYTEAGYRLLAKKVAESIIHALGDNPHTAGK